MTDIRRQRLDEIKIGDASPKQFSVFLKKWRAYARKHPISDLWVHFSNFRTDPSDKRFAPDTDHTDPSGLYVYPLKYVLNYPSDIWYGMNAAMLHVVRSKAKHPFYFKEVWSNQQIHRLIWDMFKGKFTLSDYQLNVLRNWFGHTGRGRFAKTLMSAIQFDWDKFKGKFSRQGFRAARDKDSGWARSLLRTGKSQSKLWLEAGYDMLIDEGTGAVNSREPEQAIFLTRGAFEIIDIYTLRNKEKAQKNVMTVNHLSEDFLRKVVALALDGMDHERLQKGEPLTANQGGWKRWWTTNGWRASIYDHDTSVNWRMNNTKIGDKPHKFSKTHDPYALKIEIESPYGTVSYQVDSDENLKDALKAMWREYHDMKSLRGGAPSPNWKPGSAADHLAAEKRRRELDIWNKVRRDHVLEPITMDQMERMMKNGQGPPGWYYRPKANELRVRKGLAPWDQGDWERYRDGKLKLYDVGHVASAASKDRMEMLLKRRQQASDPAGLILRKRGQPDEDGEVFSRRRLLKIDPFNSAFGPRSFSAINAFRAKHKLEPITPEQYQRYRKDPEGWRFAHWFPEPRR